MELLGREAVVFPGTWGFRASKLGEELTVCLHAGASVGASKSDTINELSKVKDSLTLVEVGSRGSKIRVNENPGILRDVMNVPQMALRQGNKEGKF